MIVEIQLATERLQRQLRSTLIASSTCTDQTIPTGDGATRYVDHIEWGPEGTVTVSFFITPSGSVTGAQGSGFSQKVASCVAEVITGIEFPKPNGGGGVQVNYPFTFHHATGAQ